MKKLNLLMIVILILSLNLVNGLYGDKINTVYYNFSDSGYFKSNPQEPFGAGHSYGFSDCAILDTVNYSLSDVISDNGNHIQFSNGDKAYCVINSDGNTTPSTSGQQYINQEQNYNNQKWLNIVNYYYGAMPPSLQTHFLYVIDLDEPFIMTNNTHVELGCYEPFVDGAYKYGIGFATDENLHYFLYQFFDDSTTNCNELQNDDVTYMYLDATTPSHNLENCYTLPDYYATYDGTFSCSQSYKTISFNITDGYYNNQRYFFNVSPVEIDNIIFFSRDPVRGNNNSLLISHLNISSINVTNNLPDYNLSTNDLLCLSDNGTIQAEWNLSVVDEESDTIYYSYANGFFTEDITQLNFDRDDFKDLQKDVCSMATWAINTGLWFTGIRKPLSQCLAIDFVSEIIDNKNYWYPNYEDTQSIITSCSIETQASLINGTLTDIKIENTRPFGDRVYENALRITPLCDDNVTIDLKRTVYDLSSVAFSLDSPSASNENYTFSIMNHKDEELVSFMVLYNLSDDAEVYLVNDSGIFLQGSFNHSGLFKYMMWINGSNIQSRFVTNNGVTGNQYVINVTTESETDELSVRKIKILEPDTNVIIDDIAFTRYYVGDFTTVAPVGEIFTSEGTYVRYLSISDSVNQPDKYNFEKIVYKVVSQDFCAQIDLDKGDNIFGDYEDVGKTGVPLFMDKFLWFIQIPYRFAFHFNLVFVFVSGLLLAQLITFVNWFWVKGYAFDIVVTIMWSVGLFIYFMRLQYEPYYLFLTLLFAFVVAHRLFIESEGAF